MTAYWKCLQFTRLIRIRNTIYKSTAHIKIPKHPLKPVMALFFWNDLSIWHHYTKLFTSHSNREALHNSLWLDEETRIVPAIKSIQLHNQLILYTYKQSLFSIQKRLSTTYWSFCLC